ncbi:Cache 3/Cache 2 fusion domain-containing protein [Dankookia sp. P2]|uniref:Cache 3/Cache 2 fusion domain-containing protein n=1 Tax=Dankookia sp. P2 TaxID=3423955 RepID=UPI003D66AC20
MKKRMLALLPIAFLAGLAVQPAVRATAGPADDVQAAMQLLKSKAAELGQPVIKGEETTGGRTVPALYFGSTKMNNNFQLVDDVQKERGGTATIFVRSGEDFVRVATNVKKDDGARAIGTVLDPKGKAFAAMSKGKPYFGEADILGRPYVTGYEPIRGSGNGVIGAYYVGYLKN